MTEAARSADPELERELLRMGNVLALGQLAPDVIHEINNPLFAILGLLEFLLAEAEPGTKTHQRLTLVQQSAREIAEVVQAVLDFARERPEEQAEISLEDVARRAHELFVRTSVARDVNAAVAAGTGPFLVSGSPNRLQQAFLALFANARQAMPRGGTVTVWIDRDGGRVRASISDTGPGIPAEIAGRVFEPFFTTSSEHGSLGLGLTIARAVARIHGGELELERAGGPGARFVLSLPVSGNGPTRESGSRSG